MNIRHYLYPFLGSTALLLGLQLGSSSCKSSSKSPSGKSSKKSEVASEASSGKVVPANVVNGGKTAKSEQRQPGSAWAQDVDRVDKQIAARRMRAEKSKSWIDWERVALLESERARLTGDYGSYVRAEEALTAAFAVADKGVGPFSTRAFLNMRLHRIAEIEPDLKAMEAAAVITTKDKNAIVGYRADVAYYTGDLKTAEKLYIQVAEAEPVVRNVASLARLYWKMGDFDKADTLLDKAVVLAEKARKSDRAWLNLMRGLMKLDQNKLDEALAFYKAGLKIQPGYWLLEEHVAEVLLLQGDIDLALEKYEDLVVRTNSPEFMDQIASIWRARGNTSEFERWRKRARVIHLEHLKLVPEAAVGHALDHFLELEDDRAKALELALQNHKIRPGGEAKEKLVSAYLLNKKFKRAQEVAVEMEETGWKTAESMALVSLAHEMAGDADKAGAARDVAQTLADDASSRVAWLRKAIAG